MLKRDELVLALDQGTHASRAVVLDGQGRVLTAASCDVGLHKPGPDRAEQDGEEIVASVGTAVAAVMASAGSAASSVAAAGLASQRASCVCWDRDDGRALTPVFSWQDRRAHRWLQQFEDRAEEVHRKTGLFLSAHYGASKLRWALENVPAVSLARDAGRLCWGPQAAFLVFRLTREHGFFADPQCAARTQLWDIHRRDWDPALAELFGVPPGYLPASVGTCHDYGTLALGPVPVPLTAVNGDQSAAVFAFGWPETDAAYINIGTSAFVQRVVDSPPPYGRRLLMGIILDDGQRRLYTVEGNVNGAGAALEWAREELEMPDLVALLPEWLEKEERLPLFLNGIAGLGGPFWQADFPSRFVGEGDARQRAVAVVESMAFLLQANLDEMNLHLPAPRRIRVSGGVSRFDGLCRRLASLSGLPVLRRDDPEATARGMGFIAAGCPDHWQAGVKEEIFPPEDHGALRARYRQWRALMAAATGV